MNNLFLFTGQETFLINEYINTWKKAFKEKHNGDINLNIIDGRKAEVGEIITQIETVPFLAEKRLIFIEGLPESPPARNENNEDKVTKKDEKREKTLQKLIDYLNKIPESSVVTFIQSNPDKRKSLYKKIVHLSTVAQDDKSGYKATIKEFKPLSGVALNKWIKDRIKKYNASIDIDSAEYLVSLTGQDLWRIDQELKKLASYSDGQTISKKDIDYLVVPTIEANVFHLTDALGLKNHRQAISNLHKIVSAGENLRQVFYMIVRQFRLFLQVGGYLGSYPNTSPNNIATSLKIHPFVARNTVSQLKHFNTSDIKKAYARLLEIDTGLKTSQIYITTDNQDELIMAIEKFILKFCQ